MHILIARFYTAPVPELQAKEPGQILVGHQDMASAGARAYNGGLWAKPPAGSMGRAPGQGVWGKAPQKLIMQYFSVFIRFSADN